METLTRALQLRGYGKRIIGSGFAILDLDSIACTLCMWGPNLCACSENFAHVSAVRDLQ